MSLSRSIAHFPRRQPAGQSQAARRLSDLSVLLHHLVAGDLALVDVNSWRGRSRAEWLLQYAYCPCVCARASTTNLHEYCIIKNFTLHPAHPPKQRGDGMSCRGREQNQNQTNGGSFQKKNTTNKDVYYVVNNRPANLCELLLRRLEQRQ